MSKQTRYTPQQKVIILRELLENQIPISQISEKYGIHVNDIYNWRKKLFEQAAENIFAIKPKQAGAKEIKQQEKQQQLEEKLKQKDEVIAELVQQNITLKKSIDGTI